MGDRRLNRLTAVDTSFLVQEHEASHMHIGGVLIFEGPMPGLDLLERYVDSRLHLIPRFRQRLVFPPYQAGRPFWVDDPHFNLDYHVRDTALPNPGSDEQLEHVCARIFSQRLDRRKPLWEVWFIDNLAGGRFAMVTKTHHAMIDGIAGVDLGTVLFSTEQREDFDPAPPWHARQMPTRSDLVTEGLRDVIRAPFRFTQRAAHVLEHPGRIRDDAAESVSGAVMAVTDMLSTAPRTPLNTEIGPHRRFKLVRNSLQDFKDIKNLLDATVNDVVLTVVADGIGRWLRHRHFPTEDLRLRALVPVSTRGAKRGNEAEAGNELRAMRGVLPVGEMDPLERLSFMKNAMDYLKDSNQAVAADVITRVENWAPPNLLAQASRLHFATWMFNLVVTNVPGPQIPLYLLGRPALDAFPIPFLARGHALCVAAMSYNGGLNFGLLGDYDALRDIDVLSGAIADSRDDLVATAIEVRDRVKQLKADPQTPKRDAAAKKKQAANGRAPASSTRAKSTNGKVGGAAHALKATRSRAK